VYADFHRTSALAINADSIDPAVSHAPGSWLVMSVTNDGLVGFRHVGGEEGAAIVPNLATSLPTPTNSGKTYFFQLRDGVRYSTGEQVKAGDVRRGIERALLLGPGAYHYSGILGADTCATAKGVTCREESSPTIRAAPLPSTSTRPIPISSTSSRCRSPTSSLPALRRGRRGKIHCPRRATT
jgi:ABC-type transport system substrate-binding protein